MAESEDENEDSLRGPYKAWEQNAIEKAAADVMSGKKNTYQAAKIYDIPYSTLADRGKGRVAMKSTAGRKPILTPEEEDSLTNYCVYMSRCGYPLTITLVKILALEIAKRSGKEKKFGKCGPTDKWWRGFKERHRDQLKLRKADQLDRGRAGVDPNDVKEYLMLLEKVLKENDLFGKPERVFNCDETGSDLNTLREKVIVGKGIKHPHSRMAGTRDHITVLASCNAAGDVGGTMVVFSGGFPGGRYTDGAPPNTIFAKSDSGYVDKELFLKWFEYFIKTCPVRERPILLIMDNHESHESLNLVDLARRNEVILLCLPPHTTHALQPLDVALFGPLKAKNGKLVKLLSFLDPTLVVNKSNFPALLGESLPQALTKDNIVAGFRGTGHVPYDPSAINFASLFCNVKNPKMMGLIQKYICDRKTKVKFENYKPDANNSEPPPVPGPESVPHKSNIPSGSDSESATLASLSTSALPPGLSNVLSGNNSESATVASPSTSALPPAQSNVPSSRPNSESVSAASPSTSALPPAQSNKPSSRSNNSESANVAFPSTSALPPAQSTEPSSRPNNSESTNVATPSTSTLPPGQSNEPSLNGSESATVSSPPSSLQPSQSPWRNLLVENKLISPKLADLLVPPKGGNPQKARTPRLRIKARVITTPEYEKMLSDKIKQKKEEEEAKQKRKEEREKRKKEKGKGKEKKRKTSEDPDYVGIGSQRPARNTTAKDDDVCGICNEENPPTDDEISDEEVDWVDCDQCCVWFHKQCVGVDCNSEHYLCNECTLDNGKQ